MHVERYNIYCTVLNYICLCRLREGPDGGQDNACSRDRKCILDHGDAVSIPTVGKAWLSLCYIVEHFRNLILYIEMYFQNIFMFEIFFCFFFLKYFIICSEC